MHIFNYIVTVECVSCAECMQAIAIIVSPMAHRFKLDKKSELMLMRRATASV